jgi:AAA15 family ATPase/GTPase
MLRSIQLENFKAFGQRTVIPLAPITLIFGQNSAGKSSILQLARAAFYSHSTSSNRLEKAGMQKRCSSQEPKTGSWIWEVSKKCSSTMTSAGRSPSG